MHIPTLSRRIAILCGILLLALALPLPAAAGGSGPMAKVSIKKMAYHPAEITVKAGTTITWSNDEYGATYHSVTSDAEGQFDSADFFPEESWSYTFGTPGTYPYHCTPHKNRMKGVVVVTP